MGGDHADLDGRIADGLPVRSAPDIAADVEPGSVLAVSGFGRVGYPKAVPLALAERPDAAALDLTVISGGNVGDEIDATLVETGAVSRRFPYQGHEETRERVNDGRMAYHDRHVAGLADELTNGDLGDVDLAVVEAVAVGPEWFVPSTSLGQTPAAVAAADALVVEVNTTAPRSLAALHDVYRPAPPPGRDPIPLTAPGDRIGDERVRFPPAKLVGVVETDRRDSAYEFRDPSPTDRAIAANLGSFLGDELDRHPMLADAVRLQFGVGALGNALMSELGEVDFGDRDVAYFGEVIQDGLLDLVDDGTLSVASATSLALSAEGQDRLFADVERYADRVVLRPADVSNAAELISRLGVVAVNSALEVDLTGNVNSTHLDGRHAVTGIGGSGDFNRASPLAITALASTAADGAISRIVPVVPHVDHTEHDIDVVVTEQGVADLRGLAPRERAGRLIERCAHPDYRAALHAYHDRALEQGGHVPVDWSTAFDWRE